MLGLRPICRVYPEWWPPEKTRKDPFPPAQLVSSFRKSCGLLLLVWWGKLRKVKP